MIRPSVRAPPPRIVLGEDRHQHGVRHAGEADQAEEEEQRAHRPVPRDVDEPFAQARPGRRGRRRAAACGGRRIARSPAITAM